MTDYLLPRDARRMVEQHATTCDNLGLRMAKYQPWERGQLSSQSKNRWFRDIAEGWQPNANYIGQIRSRWRETTQHAHRFKLMTTARLAIGLGGGGTLETGLTLHPLYGFPYLPASSLKGVARAHALYEIAAKLNVPGVTNEQIREVFTDKKTGKVKPTPLVALDQWLESPTDPKKTTDQQKVAFDFLNHTLGLVGRSALPLTAHKDNNVRIFQMVFGTLNTAGIVVFFDAMPTGVPQLAVDIMNPHFPAYYQQKEAPHEADSPNPVAFLTIDAGAEFEFAIGVRPKQNPKFAERAGRYLDNGLYELGLGSKTSSGYGLFDRKAADRTTVTHYYPSSLSKAQGQERRRHRNY